MIMWPIVLAALGILVPIVGYAVPAWLKSGYVQEADEACSRYVPQLQALGKQPPPEQRAAYHAYEKGLSAIMDAALEEWRKVDVPPIVGGEIRETFAAAQSAAQYFRTGVSWAEKGDTDTANKYLDEFNGKADVAVEKARALGLNVCPVGF